MIKIRTLYDELLEKYGEQGWWPLLDVDGENPTKTGSVKGYHPGDYSYPRTREQRFEICVGAILTQNTSWTNVEKALINLKDHDMLCPEKILSSTHENIAGLIRPAGYFNQKAKKLILFAEYFLSMGNKIPTREELLSLWGIGPETADSMLLYAFKVPSFIVDAYTRRVLRSRNLLKGDETYDEISKMFETNIETKLEIYQEFHALLVEEAKHLSSK